MKTLVFGMAFAAALLTTSAGAENTECTEITNVPFVITFPGVYCLKKNLGSALPSGNLIEIQNGNVTIDLNGFELDGLVAGPSTQAVGILARGVNNVTIRNGTIRGFLYGVVTDAGTSLGHLLEDLLLDQNRTAGVLVQGSGHVIRNNRVENTGSGDPGIEAIGIKVEDASNTVVADNVVSSTSETESAVGIVVNNSTLIEVRGNSILDTRDATTKDGIEINSSTDVTVIGNRILNPVGTGI